MVRGIKTLLSILSSIAIAGVFVGCSDNGVATVNENIQEINIGVSVYEENDIFISQIMKSLEECAKEKEENENLKFVLNIEGANGNQYNQNEQIDEFIAQGADVLCVNLVDRRSASIIINKAKTQNIPIIFFNREPVEEDMNMWDKVYYVGAKAEQSGVMQADIILDIYKKDKRKVDKNGDGKVQYVMLEGEAGHQDSLIRTEYSIKRLVDSCIKVEKLDSDIANWTRSEGRDKTEKWIDKYGKDIEVVFSNNDAMALGAIDALKKSNLCDNMPMVVGVDGISESFEAIKDGYMVGTVLSDSDKQGKDIFNIIYGLTVSNDSKESNNILNRKYTRSDHTKITSENVDEFINE